MLKKIINLSLYPIFLLLIIFSLNCFSKTAKSSTTYSLCTKNNTQIIIVAMETLSEKSCKSYGAKKANQYAMIGWRCQGLNREELYSCESEPAISFAIYKGIKVANLTFTNLQKHRSLVAYLNSTDLKLCHEDQAELIAAGVKDATCHQREK